MPLRRPFSPVMEADALQGYHFSKPLPADQFESLLKSGLPLPQKD